MRDKVTLRAEIRDLSPSEKPKLCQNDGVCQRSEGLPFVAALFSLAGRRPGSEIGFAPLGEYHDPANRQNGAENGSEEDIQSDFHRDIG